MGWIDWETVCEYSKTGVLLCVLFVFFVSAGFGPILGTFQFADVPALNTSQIPNSSEFIHPFEGFNENVTVTGVTDDGRVELQTSTGEVGAYRPVGVAIVTRNQSVPVFEGVTEECYSSVVVQSQEYIATTVMGTQKYSTFPVINTTESSIGMSEQIVIVSKSKDRRFSTQLVANGYAVVTNKTLVDTFRAEDKSVSAIITAQRNAAEQDVGVWKCQGMDSANQTWVE